MADPNVTTGSVRDRLVARLPILGILLTQPSVLVAGAAARAGYDFLFVDGEHGTFTDEDSRRIIGIARSAGLLSIVRVPDHDPSALRRNALLGADIVLVPHVSTLQEATVLVSAMPHRSPAGSAPGPSLMVVIESVAGVANARDILGVEGVDGVFVGPNDLSADLGSRGDYASPAYADAVSRIEDAARASGVFLGSVPHAGYPLERLVSRGHSILVLDVDTALVETAARSRVAAARESLPS